MSAARAPGEAPACPAGWETAALCALLRGDGDAVGEHATTGAALARAAADHGVAPLLFESLRAARMPPWTAAVADRLQGLAREEAAVDAIRAAACRDVLRACADATLEVIVFKGGALAHSHYPRSDLRPHDDIDLLVRERDRERTAALLAGLGYARVSGAAGRLASYQSLHARTDARGVRHNIDLHWRVSNRQRYAAALPVEALLARAVALPALGAKARCPEPVDALLIAAFHRAAHRGTQRLIWLFDIHLLAEGLSPAEGEALVERARESGIARECAEALVLARDAFATALPAPLARLADRQGARAAMRAPRTFDIWLDDLAALDGWRQRLALLGEHAFPAADDMLTRARVSSRLWLPLLYARRALRGLPGLFRRG